MIFEVMLPGIAKCFAERLDSCSAITLLRHFERHCQHTQYNDEEVFVRDAYDDAAQNDDGNCHEDEESGMQVRMHLLLKCLKMVLRLMKTHQVSFWQRQHCFQRGLLMLPP